jgi:hypothetical protein
VNEADFNQVLINVSDAGRQRIDGCDATFDRLNGPPPIGGMGSDASLLRALADWRAHYPAP